MPTPKPMPPAEYRAACERLGLSPTYGAPRALPISRRDAAGYSSGERPVPPLLAMLLRVLVELQAMRAKHPPA